MKLDTAQLDELAAALKNTAVATFEHKYPVEILNSLPREEAQRKIQSGEIKVEPYDAELFLLTVRGPNGEVRLHESGPFDMLQAMICDLLSARPRELSEKEMLKLLGRNPYEEE